VKPTPPSRELLEEAERDLLIMDSWIPQRIEPWQWRVMAHILASTPENVDTPSD
jgi:hypothetical protein